MSAPSPGHSLILRVQAPARMDASTTVVTRISEAGAAVTALDIVESRGSRVVVDVSCNVTDGKHRERVVAALDDDEGFDVLKVSDRTFLIHLGGKIEVTPRVSLRNRDDLSRAYTPGVARVCMAIHENVEEARRLTIKRNTVAVVTDGTAVLGLGDIGPEAALPVMEGKAALFKKFANVDAWPVCLDTKDTDEIVSIVKAVAPVYGGINLEDISAPRCFEILDRLQDELDIPVFHDDQHGTAIVTLAALYNALRVVDKRIEDVRIVVSGVGAAGRAIIELLADEGAGDIIACDRRGAVYAGRGDSDAHRVWIAEHTNQGGFTGSLKEAMVGADVFVGVSAPNLLDEEDVAAMNERAIVFALANPDPEVDPVAAAKHAAVVATGRSDFPNQINNVLAFPGLFRGLLDARAADIATPLLVAAARAIASRVSEEELNESFIIPSVFDESVAPAVAEAVTESVAASSTGSSAGSSAGSSTAQGTSRESA